MATLNLGKYRIEHKGAYDSSLAYKYLDTVTNAGKLYLVSDVNGAMAGETPPVATSKWDLLLDNSTISLDPSEIAVTDSTGKLTTMPISAGVLTADGLGNLSFQPRVISTTNGGVKVHKLISNVNSYTGGFISQDDGIYIMGGSNIAVLGIAGYSELPIRLPDVDKTGTWEKLSIIAGTIVALTSTGELWIKGQFAKQLGFNSTGVLYELTKSPLTDVVDFSLRGSTNPRLLAITSNGKMYSAGLDNYSQLGRNATTTNTRYELLEVTGFGGKVVAFATDEFTFYSSMGVITDESGDNFYTWGRNAYGEQGLGNKTQQNTPVKQVGLGNIKKAITCCDSSSYGRMMVLKSDGTIWGAGNNNYGIGDGTNTLRTTWSQAGSFNGYIDLSSTDAYYGFNLALTAGKEVHSWGVNSVGNLGRGNTTHSNVVLTNIVGDFQGKAVKVLTASIYTAGQALILDEDGQLWHSGYSGNYQGGSGTTTNHTTFTKVIGMTGLIDMQVVVSSTGTTIYGVTSDGTLKAVGYGGYGCCGNGTLKSNTIGLKVVM